jgi:hypothetical protein
MVLVFLLVLSSSVPRVQADVTLPNVLSSHMVLQRDRLLPVWGWVDPGEEVSVKFDEATATGKADAQGNWNLVLRALAAVQAKDIVSPTQVRFGWRNEANPNLVNKEGLPASPFQTNDWQGGTSE